MHYIRHAIMLSVVLLALTGIPAPRTGAFSQTSQSPLACQIAQSDVPAGLKLIATGQRSDTEIAAGFPNPSEALLLLHGWGFIRNDYWNYASPPGYITASGTNSLEISGHLFSSASSASAALVYYANGRAAMLGLHQIPFETIGDLSAAIGGYRDVGYEVTLYFQIGPALIRVSGVAPNGDPTPDVAYAALSSMCALLGY